jgi:multidrug efflux pump subunit AcrB
VGSFSPFGTLSYTTLLRREGFPSVNIPFAVVNGTYFVNDPAQVDSNVAKPISDLALKQSSVSTVQTQSAGNFFVISIKYKEGTDAKAASKALQNSVNSSGKLPKTAQVQYNVPYFGATGGDIQKIDLAVSFYSKNNTASLAETTVKAREAAKWLNDKKLSNVQTAFIKNPLENATDPATGQAVVVQHNFDRFGVRQGGETAFYNSVIIGVTGTNHVDVIKLDKQVREALTELQKQPQFKGYGSEVSASFAPNIKDNLSELQRVLLEGLLAILVVGSIVIAIRASFITVISMITVLLATLGFLYVIGYSLNVITLFALILGLALIVDDTIIMVEAIDAARRKQKDRRKVIQEATRKVSRAMVAATATASLSFVPLLFVGGILGSFIRAIPITIIASLIISLFVALIFIPFFARLLLLGKKQMGARGVKEVAAGFESRVASFIAAPMLWARNSKRRLFGVGILAIVIGLGFIIAGLIISRNVVFNIFPPTKDTNGVALTINFPPNTTIAEAQAIAGKADSLAASTIGGNFVESSYYNSGTAQSATEQVQITSYNKRAITSPQIVKQLQAKFDTQFKDAKVVVHQIDLGPPSAAFTVQLDATDRPAAFRAAQDLAAYMSTAQLKRASGKAAHFTNVAVSSPDQFTRTGGKPIVTITASFDGNDTTTLVTLAQSSIKKEFNEAKLQQYNLKSDALGFDIGQESDNQNSFKTLALAFPVLLVVMFILLAFQFRSLVQPLLIFMAIPFSIFGIMLGLSITNNPISFFAMLGFFALIGLSIKNTILLTDFANQSRRSGLGPIDAAHAALEERFRPLFATSMTAVVSLIPLALSSPFWQGLAVVLIFGLLSSTFLVLTVFPYYYLGAEYLRLHISTKDFFIWLLPTILVAVGVAAATKVGIGLLVIPASIVFVSILAFYKRRLAKV